MSKKLCEACEIFGEVPDCTDCGDGAVSEATKPAGEVITGIQVRITFKVGTGEGGFPSPSRTFERSPAPADGTMLSFTAYGFLEVAMLDSHVEYFALDTIARISEKVILDE